MNSRMLERYLMDLAYACSDVKDCKMCDECPLVLTNCLEETSVISAAEDMTASMFSKFMEFAKNCEPREDE